MRDPMHDKQFLLALDNDHNKIVYAKLISLTRDEQPIQAIEGVVQSGSINIDGSSAVRRSCSLTMTTKSLNINEVYWGFNTKIKIEIGLQNNVNDEYDRIIWFKEGTYILTDFKTSQQVNNYTINLSGKDKMCLLNGDVGGNFNAETNLKVENYVDVNGITHEIIQPIKYIVREMVHHYAQEPWANIVINNLDDYGLEMLDNATEEDYYLWRDAELGQYMYYTGNDMTETGISGATYLFNGTACTDFSELTDFIFVNGMEEDANNLVPTQPPSQIEIQTSGQEQSRFYYIFKVGASSLAGYRMTELVYDKDLIAAPGDTVTSILDKLVKMLGSFEYFYNVDGQFVFQAKDTYLNTTWQAAEDIDTVKELSYITPAMMRDKTSYYFENGLLTTAIQNNPNMLNVRNDFTVWGKKRTSDGSEVPIHARYAIDKQPLFYRKIVNGQSADDFSNLYVTTQFCSLLEHVVTKDVDLANSLKSWLSNSQDNVVDWRELIYLMAQDYYQYNHADEFEINVARTNRDISIMLDITDYLTGKTGYEQYYHDIQGFWRLLYNKEKANSTDDTLGVTYDNQGWSTLLYEDPAQLLFWFDFYDTDENGVGRYSVPALGPRPKVVNDDDVRAIIYPDVPDIIYITADEFQEAAALGATNSGYSYMVFGDSNLPDFKLSVRRKSAKEVMDNLLYTYTHTNDSISLTTIPIYYLQPNSIIHVDDKLSHINGYYEVNKITLPLAYNGTMNISAVKIPQQIY